MTENDRILEVNEVSDTTEETKWRKHSIYKIPASVTSTHDIGVYKPQMVAIGPYHHGTEILEAMEVHKLRALTRFQRRSGKAPTELRQVLRPMVQDLKDAYNQLDNNKWRNEDAFLDLMIRDGCFILELLRTTTAAVKKKTSDPASSSSHSDYQSDDPIFSDHGRDNIVPYLKRDMLMLENQIPMPVLQKLYSIKPLKEGDDKLTGWILNFLFQTPRSKIPENELKECKHILDLHRRNLLYDPQKPGKKSKAKGSHPQDEEQNIIRSAKELHDAGISIKGKKTKSLRDISFNREWCGGVLCLPIIVVDDTFKSLYLNMIAYERFHVGAGNEVTSYIFFMDNIIENVEDVALLHSAKVIQNALGSDEAVAKLFNSLSKDSVLNPNSELAEVHDAVSRFCENRWPRWRAYCCHNYFTNPWVAISVAAAIFIFAVTIVSTVYTVLAYVKPPGSG